MSENKYVLYHYLEFFWKKKIWFIPLPLMFVLAVFVYDFTKDVEYKGQSTVYTSEIRKSSITRPDIVQANYRKKLGEDADKLTLTAVDKRITFNFIGDSKDLVEKNLNNLVNDYLDELMNYYSVETKYMNDQINSINNRLEIKESKLDILYDDIKDNITANAEVILFYEEEIQSYYDKLYELKNSLLKYDKPQVLTFKVDKANTYLLPNIITSIIGGFIITLFALMLYKYILDARRATKE